MRILIVTDYYQSKIGYAKVTVAHQLQKLGHTVAVLTSDRYFPFHNYADTAGKILGNRIRKSGTYREGGLIVYRQKTIIEFLARVIFPGVRHRIHVFKPDVVIVFGVSSPSAVQVALVKKWHPTLVPQLFFADSHLPSEFQLGNNLSKQLFYGMFRLLFSRLLSSQGDKFIALQDDTVGIINQVYGIHKKVAVIPNGTDPTLFRFDSYSRKKIRKELGIGTHDFVITYTGKLVPSKGIDILMSAFVKLSAKHTNIWCVLVGDGPSEYKTQFLSTLSKPLRRKAIITGMVKPNMLPSYYSAADVGVWPLQESLAMVDAASCKLPFIANDELGAHERIKNKNALLYKKGEWKDLARKIELLYRKPDLRKKMGINGRQLVIRELGWEKIAKAYITT